MFDKVALTFEPEYCKYANYSVIMQQFFSKIREIFRNVICVGIQVRCMPLEKTSALRASIFPIGIQD